MPPLYFSSFLCSPTPLDSLYPVLGYVHQAKQKKSGWSLTGPELGITLPSLPFLLFFLLFVLTWASTHTVVLAS